MDYEFLDYLKNEVWEADLTPAPCETYPVCHSDEYDQLVMDAMESGLDLPEQFLSLMTETALTEESDNSESNTIDPQKWLLSQHDPFVGLTDPTNGSAELAIKEQMGVPDGSEATGGSAVDKLDDDVGYTIDVAAAFPLGFSENSANSSTSFAAIGNTKESATAVLHSKNSANPPVTILTIKNMKKSASAVLDLTYSKNVAYSSVCFVSFEAQEKTLKLTRGSQAWRRWVALENARLAADNKTVWPQDFCLLGPEILPIALCHFIKGVRRLNGEEYAPDTIYYFLIDIQRTLHAQGRRTETFWSDKRYAVFARCFDELAKRYKPCVGPSARITSWVSEKLLWLSDQIGLYTPLDLLTSLIYFNTVYYGKRSIQEHYSLNFSKCAKYWRNKIKRAGSVYVLPKRRDAPYVLSKKLMHQFYLCKCPSDRMHRTNLIYYLQPEETYIKTSPIWYARESLREELFECIFRRLMMVKEFQQALKKWS